MIVDIRGTRPGREQAVIRRKGESPFPFLTALGRKQFRKKTPQTAHEGYKILQTRRLTFHLILLRYSDRDVF